MAMPLVEHAKNIPSPLAEWHASCCVRISECADLRTKRHQIRKRGVIMRHESCWHTPHTSGMGNYRPAADPVEDYVWSTSEESKARVTSLFIIQAIVAKHGGTVDIDLATDMLSINVPPEKELACAQEIAEQMGAMCH